jgi:hypothetical protein
MSPSHDIVPFEFTDSQGNKVTKKLHRFRTGDGTELLIDIHGIDCANSALPPESKIVYAITEPL